MKRFFVLSENTIVGTDNKPEFTVCSQSDIHQLMVDLCSPDFPHKKVIVSHLSVLRLATEADFKRFKVKGDYSAELAEQAKETAMTTELLEDLADKLLTKYRSIVDTGMEQMETFGLLLDNVASLTRKLVFRSKLLQLRSNAYYQHLRVAFADQSIPDADKALTDMLSEAIFLRNALYSTPLKAAMPDASSELIARLERYPINNKGNALEQAAYQVKRALHTCNALRGYAEALNKALQEADEMRLNMDYYDSRFDIISYDYGVVSDQLTAKGLNCPPLKVEGNPALTLDRERYAAMLYRRNILMHNALGSLKDFNCDDLPL